MSVCPRAARRRRSGRGDEIAFVGPFDVYVSTSATTTPVLGFFLRWLAVCVCVSSLLPLPVPILFVPSDVGFV